MNDTEHRTSEYTHAPAKRPRHANPDRYRLDDYRLTADGPVRVRVIGHYGTTESAQWRLDTRQSRYPGLYLGEAPTHRMEIVDTQSKGEQ